MSTELTDDDIVSLARIASASNNYSGGRWISAEFSRADLIAFARAVIAANPCMSSFDHFVGEQEGNGPDVGEINQCDGCAVAAPVNALGIHRYQDGSRIACTASLYASLPSERPEAGDGWQPIETAPKDGTVILIYVPQDWHGVTWAASWYESHNQSFGDPEYPWVIFDPTMKKQLNAWTADRVTHWMPLPKPPALAASQGAQE